MTACKFESLTASPGRRDGFPSEVENILSEVGIRLWVGLLLWLKIIRII